MLKESKERIWESLEGGKGREKCCNYIIILKKDIQIYRNEHLEIKPYASLTYFTIPK